MRHLRIIIALVGLVAILGSMVFSIQEKEDVLANGQTILLPTAPRDPRSKMQGDYMVLNYADEIYPSEEVIKTLPYKGFVILNLDEDKKASFARLDNGESLAESEVRILYRRASGGWQRAGMKYAARSYFFEEGQGGRFNAARFVMVVVGPDGKTVMTGMADESGIRIPDKLSTS